MHLEVQCLEQPHHTFSCWLAWSPNVQTSFVLFRCPYAGCANLIPLVPNDLEDNLELKEHIEKQKNS